MARSERDRALCKPLVRESAERPAAHQAGAEAIGLRRDRPAQFAAVVDGRLNRRRGSTSRGLAGHGGHRKFFELTGETPSDSRGATIAGGRPPGHARAHSRDEDATGNGGWSYLSVKPTAAASGPTSAIDNSSSAPRALRELGVLFGIRF